MPLNRYKKKDETNEQFAERLGVCRKQLYNMCKKPGIIRLKEIHQLAKITGIDAGKIARQILREMR